MTTIACKDGIMAADSLVAGSYIDQVEYKKIQKIGNEIIACAGELTKTIYFFEWYEKGRNIKDWDSSLSESFAALVLFPSYEILYYGGQFGHGVNIGKVGAIGTGERFAMGAMLAGSSAKQAVKIACKLDVDSKEPIMWVSQD